MVSFKATTLLILSIIQSLRCTKNEDTNYAAKDNFTRISTNESNHFSVMLNKSPLNEPKNGWITNEVDFVSRSGVLIEGDAVYAPTDDGISKINRNTGGTVWQLELCDYPEGNMIMQENTIFLSSEECFYAIDKKNGDVLWGKDITHPITATPVVVNDLVIISDESKGVYAFESNSGKLRWVFPIVDGSNRSIPLYQNGKLFVASAFGILYVLNPVDGKKITEFSVGDKEVNVPLIGIDNIIVLSNVDSEIFLYDENGAQLWEFKYPNPTRIYFKGAAYNGGKIILTGRTNTNEEITVCVSSDTRKLIWEHKSGKQSKISNPLIVNNSDVLIASSEGLYCLNIESGNVNWTKPITSSSGFIQNQSTPFISVTNREIIYTTFDNRLVKLIL
ncbi:MAG: PQQ-binding-like beta-propeller repeat protein [Bacteroidia bacterium]|nr:PQQ-binding-like beta-propeller repeat protein [Bacteroidia bacterium]